MNNGDSIQSLGGHARAASLSDARKAEIAQKAAETRWGQKKQSLLQIPIGDGLACIPYPMSQERRDNHEVTLKELFLVKQPRSPWTGLFRVWMPLGAILSLKT